MTYSIQENLRGKTHHQPDAFITRLAEAGCRHTGSLIGVARLAFPEMMIEIEATAVA